MQGNGTYGVVKPADSSNGLRINGSGEPAIVDADHSVADSRAAGSYPITTNGFDYAVKAAMCDGKGAAWTDEEQAAAKERMGIGDHSLPKATATALGGVKVGNGLNVTDDGTSSVGLPTVEVVDNASSIAREQYDTINTSWPNVMFKKGITLYRPLYATDTSFCFGSINTYTDGSLNIPDITVVAISFNTLKLTVTTSNLRRAKPGINSGYGIMAVDGMTLNCSNYGQIMVNNNGIRKTHRKRRCYRK